MTDMNSIADILRVGVSKEVESNVFYNLLSQYIVNPQISEICKDLASEELEHKAKLELEIIKIGNSVSPYQKNTNIRPLDYMVDMSKVMQMNYEELLVLAMTKEKESFRFYIELFAMAAKPELRDVIMELAEEEARHKMRFEIQYDMYVSGKDKSQE